jgi:hypothetical protein
MDVEPLSRGESGVHGSRPTRRRRSANGRKTLVVNDHVEVRSVITESLRQRGFIVIPVRDTDSARVLCERVALDLILLNLVVLEEAERAFTAWSSACIPEPAWWRWGSARTSRANAACWAPTRCSRSRSSSSSSTAPSTGC